MPCLHRGRSAARRVAALLATAVAAAVHAENQIANWTPQAGSTSWSDPLNWTPQTVPANNGTTVFNAIVPNNSIIAFDLPNPTTISGMSFGSGGTLTIASGSQLVISDVGVMRGNWVASS